MAIDLNYLVQFAILAIASVAVFKAYLKHDMKMVALDNEEARRRHEGYIERDIKKAQIEAGIMYGDPFGSDDQPNSDGGDLDLNSLLENPEQIMKLLQNPAIKGLLQNIQK